jgi:hypothetical protein
MSAKCGSLNTGTTNLVMEIVSALLKLPVVFVKADEVGDNQKSRKLCALMCNDSHYRSATIVKQQADFLVTCP